jgi:hypothetical protein
MASMDSALDPTLPTTEIPNAEAPESTAAKVSEFSETERTFEYNQQLMMPLMTDGQSVSHRKVLLL